MWLQEILVIRCKYSILIQYINFNFSLLCGFALCLWIILAATPFFVNLCRKYLLLGTFWYLHKWSTKLLQNLLLENMSKLLNSFYNKHLRFLLWLDGLCNLKYWPSAKSRLPQIVFISKFKSQNLIGVFLLILVNLW